MPLVFTRIALLLVMCCGVLACASLPFGASSERSATAFKLPPLPLPRDSVELDVVFIDRPAGDPLLGRTLWREVDQVGTLTSEQRTALREAGIQVGHVGASPPDALQSLLNLADEERERKRREANGLAITASRRVALPAGTDMDLPTSESVSTREVELPGGERKELQETRGVLRLRAERSQEGWARLDFVPELHHGQTRTRPFAAVTGWQYRTTQEVLPFYSQQFAATLNVGEMLIITADRERAGSLGQQLFQFDDATGTKQRVVVIRLAEMREIQAKRLRRE